MQSEWLEGNQLMRQQIFVLPKVEQAPGLSSVGVEASPDAKGLIMDMLVWNPDKRKTAEQVLYTSIWFNGFLNSFTKLMAERVSVVTINEW